MKDENKDIKNSIIKEALIEYNQIMEAANITAKNELAVKYKGEFDKFLNEELKNLNNKNNIVESTEEINESEMKQDNIIKEDMGENQKDANNVNVDDFPIEEVEETEPEETNFNFNIDDIEKEIGDLENTQPQEELPAEELPTEELPAEENKEEKAYNKLLELQNEIAKIIEELKEGEQEETQDAVPAENKEGEQPNDENEVDEIYTQSLSGNKRAGSDTMPRPQYFPPKENKLRIALRNEMAESFNKKFTSLLNENKKSVKELNLTKKGIIKAKNLNEGYKIALEKYRTQLQEMAVFNTNLANVNNLLMTEELSLNSEDKIKIINEFKKVKSITESETKYSEMLTEMKQTKKSISETLEEKLSVSIQPSSKNILDESIDKNKKSDNDGLSKIMKQIRYIERNDKK